MQYNPFTRNFNRIRRVLIETLGLPRRAIRPSAKLAELIPHNQRQRVLDRLCSENLDLDTITVLPFRWVVYVMAVMATWLLISISLGMSCLLAVPGAVLVMVALSWVLGRFFEMDVEPTLTVEDLVLAMTSPSQCREAGYQMTHNEIFLKVRRVLSDAGSIELSEITPEKTLRDLGFFE